jgi:hypothetical protein
MSSKPQIVLLALALAVCAATDALAAGPRVEAPTLATLDAGGQASLRITRFTNSSARRLAALNWTGGSYTTSTGEAVVVYVSTSYPADASVGRRWADYFASLDHGAELHLLRAYVAPLDEVEEMCGGEALGCYGGSRLVMVGDSSAGIPPASVAAHEYGHHIAANRNNAPWLALDWGTKRWATYTSICKRVRAGTAYPGDEDSAYTLNPGEGFAESYRVLIETGGTALGYDWPIVADAFRPDAHALERIRDDVLHPWFEAPPRTIRGKFPGRNRTWTTKVATPLDGDLRVRLTVPDGGVDELTLLAGDGKTRLATAVWDAPGTKSLKYQACGDRSLTLRVTRGGSASRFTLRVTVP